MSSSSTTPIPSIPSTFSPYFPSPTVSQNNPGIPTGSSTLYLFTFLATLLLLLAVSTAIVVRSFIIRRRFRRRVEEALAQGIYLPNAHGRRRDFGEKPILWDAHLSGGRESWGNMKPVSAKIISEKHTGSGRPLFDELGQYTGDSNSDAPESSRRGIARVLRNPFSRSRPSSSPSTPPIAETTLFPSTHPEEQTELAKLQVSVLIAMPSPSHPFHASSASSAMSLKGKERSMSCDEDEEVPDVVFGVAHVPWRIRSIQTGEATPSIS
ncbi:hypothetical protein BD410DRAFT_788805 [Rickenella mellea]|uniref:Uncharacterized protein n=1 Tax=Rickenella mellea TaxID=50990 RepID=A0A4Y7Q4I2_9AGAM|nr:hypothetical protein BD410DRAFT_788805 [Rickenella mellea]